MAHLLNLLQFHRDQVVGFPEPNNALLDVGHLALSEFKHDDANIVVRNGNGVTIPVVILPPVSVLEQKVEPPPKLNA